MTDATSRSRSIGRSIGAVFAGFVVVVIFSIASDEALRAAGIFPALGQRMSDGLFMLATFYRSLYSVAGSYIAARLAPHRPMKHALALGVVGVVVSTIGAVATWNKEPEFGPHWYPLALIVLAMPCAWLGGRLHVGSRTQGRS
jgi:surface polysaccharide O-acyltransferase-like enzyme